jgi:hypothetical protein
MEITAPIAAAALRANSSLDAALADAHARYAAARPRSAEIHAKARASLAGGNTRSVLFYAPFPTAGKSAALAGDQSPASNTRNQPASKEFGAGVTAPKPARLGPERARRAG